MRAAGAEVCVVAWIQQRRKIGGRVVDGSGSAGRPVDAAGQWKIGIKVPNKRVEPDPELIGNLQFRIGLYPFVRYLYSYFPLTSSINGSSSTPGTINYAAANLATLLDPGNNANLGSGGTHFENAFSSMNNLITSVGDGSSSTNTQPYVFLVTDGAQNFQTQWSGSWAGNNGATVMPTGSSSLCKPLRDRGIIISVRYSPYQPIQNPTHVFNNEDYVANANIPNIPPSLTDCATPPDAGGSYYYTANSPTDIQDALNKMFKHALQSAHITN